MGFGGFDLFFALFSLMFLLVFGVIVYSIVTGISRDRANNKAPRISAQASVVAKRQDFHSGTMHNNGGQIHRTAGWTKYYATFQFESGDRMEFMLEPNEYGLIAEGDAGKLTFQGTRFISFERQ